MDKKFSTDSNICCDETSFYTTMDLVDWSILLYLMVVSCRNFDLPFGKVGCGVGYPVLGK